MPRHLILICAVLLVACADAPAAPEDLPAQIVSEPNAPVVAASDTSLASSETLATFDRVMDTARGDGFHTRSYGEIVQAVGEAFIGTPYQDGLLDVGSEETLVVDLTAFDCVLFVENVMALARGIAMEDYSFATYVGNLEDLRYRNGSLDGYCSRLHYFTDWIHDNSSRRHVTNITQQIGGELLPKTLNFMTTHRDSYSRLASDAAFACIVGMEDAIRGRELLYVPQNRIASIYGQLQAGDVIATATHIGGLDVTHTGFVDRSDNGSIGFLHASGTGEVKIAADLATYIQSNNVQIGIIVARPVDPRSSARDAQ